MSTLPVVEVLTLVMRSAIEFNAADRGSAPAGAKLVVDRAYVDAHVGELARNEDLSRFIL